jgi:hypothetical protein
MDTRGTSSPSESESSLQLCGVSRGEEGVVEWPRTGAERRGLMASDAVAKTGMFRRVMELDHVSDSESVDEE